MASLLENVSRRRFLQGTAGAGAFVLALRMPGAGAVTTYPTGASGMPHGTVNDPRVFVAIDPDGTVTIVAHRSEMGQGARTSVPMVLADELEADWARVRLVQAPGDEPRYGNQDTDGSRSMRHFIQPMRQCGAAARMMLEQAAAERWGVPAGEVRAQLHEVVHSASGRRLGYGELASALTDQPVPALETLQLKEPAQFRYMGKGNVSIYDLKDITTGKAVYGSDVRLPDMRYAVVARPPVVGGTVRGFDAAAALAVPGVEQVIEIPGSMPPAKFAPLGGIAVVATNSWAALKGREALKIDWDDGPNAVYDSDSFRSDMEALSQKPGTVVRDQGDVEAALAGAASTYVAEYYCPHFGHATMETPHAVAVVRDGACEVWAPVQSPYGTRQDLAAFLDLPIEQVTVNVTLLGGGFGRKSKCDFALEAAHISRELGGTPVLVTWTREDDLQHAFYHTVSLERIEAGLDADGKVVAWRHRSVAPSIMSTFVPNPEVGGPFEIGMGLQDVPFDVPNLRAESIVPPAHTRIGWFRSVSNIPHAFAIQSFAAELAALAGRDQLDYLLELIGPARLVDPGDAGILADWNYGEPHETFPLDTGRLRHVLELVAAEAGWGRSLPAGRGLGLAVNRSFVSYVATAVEVEVGSDGRVAVPVVHIAIDCGFPVNPERIRAQCEGGVVMGQTLAFHSEITFKAGRVQQSNFTDFELTRIDTYPRETHVHIVPHGIEVVPSGVGEPPVPPYAPALYNAIFNATGQRYRSLPLARHGLRPA
jgi:isoquinoline 1-oxidoreductase beta subunit